MDDLTGSLARPTSSANNGSNFQDIASLDNLRQQAQNDEGKALEKVAKKFEGIFMQMLLKSMREANAGFESDSPFSSAGNKMYRNMHDQQLALDLSEQGSLGLADLIVQQLGPQTGNYMPASALRVQRELMGQMSSPVKPVKQAANKISVVQNERETAKDIPAPVRETTSLPKILSFNSPQEFVDKLMPYAKKAAQSLGGSPSVLLAQAALETGWGQKVVANSDGQSSFNLFNIKADRRWQGEQASVKTIEFRQGVAVRENAKFRSYPSLEESFNDYVGFIKNSSRYQDAVSKIQNPASFLHSLQQAGYATDPNYAKKILSVLEQVTKLAR